MAFLKIISHSYPDSNFNMGGGADFIDPLEDTIVSYALRRDNLGIYLDEAGKFPVLSRDDERVLALKLKDMSVSSEERANARQKLIQSNLRWVVHLAKRYEGRGLPLLDLIQEGNLALMKALNRYQTEFGVRFTTYAEKGILGAFDHAVFNKVRGIRVPVHIEGERRRLSRDHDDAQLDTGDESFPMNIRLEKLIMWTYKMVSLDDPLNFTTNEESLVDTIRSSVTSPEEEVMSMQGIQFVRKIIDEAVKDPINLEIFKRLEGIDRKQQEPETICSELGITKWKVVEGKRKALQQIHSAFFREQVTLSELYDLKTTLDPIPTLISLLKR